jgi:hypothetical protein
VFATEPFVGAVVAWTVFAGDVRPREVVSLVIASVGVSFVLRSGHEHEHHMTPSNTTTSTPMATAITPTDMATSTNTISLVYVTDTSITTTPLSTRTRTSPTSITATTINTDRSWQWGRLTEETHEAATCRSSKRSSLLAVVHPAAVIGELCTPPLASKLRLAFEQFLDAFPDWHQHLVKLVAEGDAVVARFICTGTHQRTWQGLQPSGRPMRIDEVYFFTLHDNLIIRMWGLEDTWTRMRQLAGHDVTLGELGSLS